MKRKQLLTDSSTPPHPPFPFPASLISLLIFRVQYVESDEFYDNPFWFRLVYMVPMFMIFRTRLYSAWLLSECMCMTAGFAAYPAAAKSKCGNGPTNFKALEQVSVYSAVVYPTLSVHFL